MWLNEHAIVYDASMIIAAPTLGYILYVWMKANAMAMYMESHLLDIIQLDWWQIGKRPK